eukprot:EC788876.1.p3 GENE.EC788876.1~~EC788876.1.p3  ORF type:complete len:63 (-),score=4.42 EC788876.1:80-268(-)
MRKLDRVRKHVSVKKRRVRRREHELNIIRGDFENHLAVDTPTVCWPKLYKQLFAGYGGSVSS